MTKLYRTALLATMVGTMLVGSLASGPLRAAPATLPPTAYLADAQGLVGVIRDNYAYLDDLPGGRVPASPQLDAERDAVHDADTLLRYAEDMITALADHHAITGRSFHDDWAIVPTYADLWIARAGAGYSIDAVKPDSLADRAGIRAGDRLVKVDGQPIDAAIAAFWSRIGLAPTGERGPYAARVLAAGRRDRSRVLTLVGAGGQKTVSLDSLYRNHVDRPALSVTTAGEVTSIRFNNSIGEPFHHRGVRLGDGEAPARGVDRD